MLGWFPRDFESVADILEELVCERVRNVALDAAWKSEVDEDIVGERVDNGL